MASYMIMWKKADRGSFPLSDFSWAVIQYEQKFEKKQKQKKNIAAGVLKEACASLYLPWSCDGEI